MPAQLPPDRRGRRHGRVLPFAAVLVAAAVPCAPAAAQGFGSPVGTTLAVAGDSVIVADQPAGRTTIRVTRPDAVTGKPVVIGQFSGDAQGTLPFTVNTTNPTDGQPEGDCWQSGALSQALTPDILPGDTVTATGEPDLFGGSAPATSITVSADTQNRDGGPIPGCRSVAPFAQNAVTTAPESVTGGPIALSGIAQPLASGVSSSVTDGTRSTTPVDVTPAADGSWSSAIPAEQVDALATGGLTVRPVFAVPDVSTGEMAHIAGAPLSTQKRSRGQAGGGPSAGATSQPAPAGGATTKGGTTPVSRLLVRSPVSIASARRNGLSASYLVPQGARVVDVRLLLGKRTVIRKLEPVRQAGARQTVRLGGTALRRVLHRGRYTLAVRAGASRRRLGSPVLSPIRVR